MSKARFKETYSVTTAGFCTIALLRNAERLVSSATFGVAGGLFQKCNLAKYLPRPLGGPFSLKGTSGSVMVEGIEEFDERYRSMEGLYHLGTVKQLSQSPECE